MASNGSTNQRRIWLESPQHMGRLRLLVPANDAPVIQQAWAELPSDVHPAENAKELISGLETRVSAITLKSIVDQVGPVVRGLPNKGTPTLEAVPEPKLPALARLAARGDARIVLTFGGQAQSYIEDLDDLYRADANARNLIESCGRALAEELAGGARLYGLHPLGLDLVRWIREPSERPSAEELAASSISQPLIFVTQMARLASLGRFGLQPSEIRRWAVATTGHSQGIVAAAIAAEAHTAETLIERATQISRYMLWQGLRMELAGGERSRNAKPMVAITGWEISDVEPSLEGLTETAIGLVNGPRRLVLSGPSSELKEAMGRLEKAEKDRAAAFARGEGAPPVALSIEQLSVSAPFHSPAMEVAIKPLKEDWTRLGLSLDADRFVVPVLRYEDGQPYQGTVDVVTSQCVKRVDWPATMSAVRNMRCSHAVDLGPGTGVAVLDAVCLAGAGTLVLAAAARTDRERLKSIDEDLIRPPAPWASYRPTLRRRPGGALALSNRFTETTGRPPILLPGMTPTTAESPLVAAAANAGYFAELAGGGQPSEAIFRARAEELRSALAPGEGYLFNALYLDPYLWGLQLGKDRLVQKLRKEGHPIVGVTISAGLPPVEEGAALLRELAELGITWNSLKAGNDEQLARALAIADAWEDGPLILQVEGGRAGGHHSFEDLEELLLTWYGRIRRRSHVLLAVGGGIGTPERARDFLLGDWSLRHGRSAMPVDAVFSGTVAMACLEARTSPAVKEALVHASGGPQLLAEGTQVGDIRSGKSGLGADIYYVDNRAARVGSLLAEVAGDAAAVAARHDEIADALAGTAKPWIGDLGAYSYGGLLERLCSLMALGRGGAFEDGPWLDVSHRGRFHAMLERSLRRCAWTDVLPAAADLDAPSALVTELRASCPALDETPLLPEDRVFFLEDVCRRPGKPMPFVPVIDANVQRWYNSDALWQSHDDRYEADQVLIIPGPTAVDGITRVDEPVAELLERMLSTSVASLPEPEVSTPWNPVDVALAARTVLMGGRTQANPLPGVMAQGGQRAELRATGPEEVELRLTHPLPDGSSRELILPLPVRDHAIPVSLDGEAFEALRDFYRRVLPTDSVLGAARLESYRRSVGEPTADAPLQSLFARALPPMMEVLLGREVGGNPLSLLHLQSEISQLSPISRDVPLVVDVQEPAINDEAGGRRVRLRVDLIQDGEPIARLDQQFLIRVRETDAPQVTTPEPTVEDALAGQLLERPRPLFDEERIAPLDLSAFAWASGDTNPIHRDPALAALAGLDQPIVHGQWTASAACALLAGEGGSLTRCRARYLAPVAPGATLRFRGTVVGRVAGDEIIEVEVTAEGVPVLSLTARREHAPTALIFPGQGCQERGMGMAAYQRSPAARTVWDRADSYTLRRYGFSLLEIIRQNPTEIDVGGSVTRHPEGVLHATQFSQVGLTVLACAGVAALREQGAIPTAPMFAGHSVGEYSALAALTEVLPLEDLIDIVYERGLTMQNFVPRDAAGRSPYAMGVIRPHRIGIDGSEAIALVEKVSRESGAPLYVVNHNIEGRQYAVAGHRDAIVVLEEQLRQTAGPEHGAWLLLPGIDVPFHSPLIGAGVPAFRRTLERCVPQDFDAEALVGRYVPNLVARTFELTESFVDAIISVTGTDRLNEARRTPADHARGILIELLAWQFASPVRWIETQALLVDQVEALVEVGPAPVLGRMMKRSPGGQEINILHAETDWETVIGLGPEAVEEEEASIETASPTPAKQVAPTPAAAPAKELDDEAMSVADALLALLALITEQTPSEISVERSIDDLLGGNSARRNQVLLDLGKEFGAGPVDGAHTLPIQELAGALERSVGTRYRHAGPYIKVAQDQTLKRLGLSRKRADGVLHEQFGLPSARRAAVLTVLCFQPEGMNGQKALEQAAEAYAAQRGITLARPQEVGGQASVDPALMAQAAAANQGHWLGLARQALAAGGLDPILVERAAAARTEAPQTASHQLIDAGPPRFRPGRHVALTSVTEWGRADALRLYWKLLRGEPTDDLLERLPGMASEGLLAELEHLADRAERAGHADAAEALWRCRTRARDELSRDGAYQHDTALVTGAGPNSIGESLIQQLLAGGARVIVTCSRPTRSRVRRYRGLYRAHARRGAELHIVPFNQGSFEDIEALCQWLCHSAYETRGAQKVRTKSPWLPTLFFPFGAAPAEGDASELDPGIAASLQVNLVGVTAMVGRLSVALRSRGADAPRVHVVLPLSPNHGQMGRDGLYAEAKSGLEALLARWRSERSWGDHCTLVGARIGWVRGTGLMGGLDRVWKHVEAELGIRTFAPEEMARLLLTHCDSGARRRAALAPLQADLTGGLTADLALRPVINSALAAAGDQPAEGSANAGVDPLPCPLFQFPQLPTARATSASLASLEGLVAIVGMAEVGPFGNERIRWAFERDQCLSTEAALELAWLTGCIRFDGHSWLDADSGEAVDPAELFDRYDLASRCGVRTLESLGTPQEAFSEVVLTQDLSFHEADPARARSFQALDPEHTELIPMEDGGYQVVRRAGSRIRVPRQLSLERNVAGQLPEGWNAERLGLDPALIRQVDPMVTYNLVATSEAFRSAGLVPEELWSATHPSRIGNTQGSGMGGMQALQRLYTDPLLDKTRQGDILQESLINVAVAYPAIALYGGYGPMLNPVAACATAALSVEAGADLIQAGKADFVVAGAFDDLGPDGVRGFADMAATISPETLDERGLEPQQASRPMDARRGGFVEAQGGGTLILARADMAVELGLPIYGFVAGAWSRGDGLQRSVPAPGPGLLSIAAGGSDSPLGRALGRFGLDADDIAVASLHGTSTDANDLNETRLHADLAASLGRSAGNPLPVIAQKAITGHAKGGAAAWQLIGLLQSMNDSVVPGLSNLDEVDERLSECGDIVYPDQAIHTQSGALRAGILTSLGFGHVGAAVCVVHPDVVLEQLAEDELKAYANRREARWRERFAAQHSVLMGEEALFVHRTEAPLRGRAERAMLRNPQGRIHTEA